MATEIRGAGWLTGELLLWPFFPPSHSISAASSKVFPHLLLVPNMMRKAPHDAGETRTGPPWHQDAERRGRQGFRATGSSCLLTALASPRSVYVHDTTRGARWGSMRCPVFLFSRKTRRQPDCRPSGSGCARQWQLGFPSGSGKPTQRSWCHGSTAYLRAVIFVAYTGPTLFPTVSKGSSTA
ncbi:hypothetical protein F4802DRAFT_76797 [Xylaria palmicola]|nr:hypothetical protein F4802DRAFT_76797 [Xylaria palmicola]